VLVEGDSDELVFQRAYMDANKGRLPIQDGIDVVSVGLTFKRFLDIAKQVDRCVGVVTDNDGDYQTKITKKYTDYQGVNYIRIFADTRESLPTLEFQFVDANQADLKMLREVIGLNETEHDSVEKIVKYMVSNKTTWALKVFESRRTLLYPKYINDAVAWCNEQQ